MVHDLVHSRLGEPVATAGLPAAETSELASVATMRQLAEELVEVTMQAHLDVGDDAFQPGADQK